MSSSNLFSKSEKLLIAILALVQFSHIVDFMIMMPLGPQLMRSFAVSPKQFSFLVSSYTFAAGISGLMTAFFADRFDRKKTLMFFFIGFSLGTWACAFANSYWSLLLTRTLTGVFGGVISSLALAIVSDTIDITRRATAMGLLMTAFSLASVFGVPFSLALANQFGWNAPFMFLGILCILLVFLIHFFVPTMVSHLRVRVLTEPFWVPVLQLLKSKNQLIALLFMSMLVLGQFSVIPFLSPSLVANTGLKETQLPFIYLVGGICSMISAPLIGRWADLYGKSKVFVIGATGSLGPVLILTSLGATSLPTILSIVAIFFLFIGGRMIPATAMVSATVASHQRGTFMSLVASVQQFSSAIAAIVSGSIVVSEQGGHLLNYQWVGYFAVTCSLVAIYLHTQLKFVEQVHRPA